MLTKPCRLPSVFTLHKMANLAFSRMLREQYADGSAGEGATVPTLLGQYFWPLPPMALS